MKIHKRLATVPGVAALLCLALSTAHGQTSQPVTYTTFQGKVLSLYPWAGQKVVVLTASPNLDASVMRAIVSALDGAWGVYEQITGRDPDLNPSTSINGKDIIAEVPDGSTCGAGCSYIGATGTEIASTYFALLYDGVRLHNQFDQVPFYEFGRNFWFYDRQLGTVGPFVTGFAIANRFISIDRTGLAGGPFNGILPYAEFESTILNDLLDSYLNNPAYDWRNTLAIDRAPPSAHNWTASDLAGALFYRIYRDKGINGYTAFWSAIKTQRPATTGAEAVANFIAAAKEATATDYGFLFKSVPVFATKPGIFRQGFLWVLDANGNHMMDDGPSPGPNVFGFGGLPGDIPIFGDWNGDGRTKVGFVRNGNQWFLDYNGNHVFDGPVSDRQYTFGGLPGDIPVVGDWTGDGKSKIGVFRGGVWILDLNGNGIEDPAEDAAAFAFGGFPGDVPVVGDWTGSGKSNVGVFRQGFFWMLDTLGDHFVGAAFPYGGFPGDLPVVGDWAGTGVTQAGIFRQGFLWVLDANGNRFMDDGPGFIFAFGGFPGPPADLPVVGKW